MVKSFWPTPQAEATAPEIAKSMNEKLKVVASHKSFEPGWNNVTVIGADVTGAVKKPKEQPGKTIGIFGSNNLCVSVMQEGLVDEFKIIVNPVALGDGSPLFRGLPGRAELALTQTRKSKSGALMLTYVPAAK